MSIWVLYELPHKIKKGSLGLEPLGDEACKGPGENIRERRLDMENRITSFHESLKLRLSLDLSVPKANKVWIDGQFRRGPEMNENEGACTFHAIEKVSRSYHSTINQLKYDTASLLKTLVLLQWIQGFFIFFIFFLVHRCIQIQYIVAHPIAIQDTDCPSTWSPIHINAQGR